MLRNADEGHFKCDMLTERLYLIRVDVFDYMTIRYGIHCTSRMRA